MNLHFFKEKRIKEKKIIFTSARIMGIYLYRFRSMSRINKLSVFGSGFVGEIESRGVHED